MRDYSNRAIIKLQVPISKIVSGGQTGVDRAAFDVALECAIAIGGWVPKGRAAEDGVIDPGYPNLLETPTGSPAERTRLNVRDSDATLVLSNGILTGGSALTKEFAGQYSRPFLHIDFQTLPLDDAVTETRRWLRSTHCRTLNIAGPRASEDINIYKMAKLFLTKLLE